MSRKCEICNKGVISGVQYSHSHRQTKRTWAPNIKKVKAIVEGTHRTIHVCTRCLRSGKVQRAI
jgi:large subunit ribosomal protein L28